MLRNESNGKIVQIKRRKLYTPLSDEEDVAATEKAVENVIIDNQAAVKPTEQEIHQIENDQDVITKIPPTPEEAVENEIWRHIWPRFGSKVLLISSSIWKYRFQFNPVDIANRIALINTKLTEMNQDTTEVPNSTNNRSENNNEDIKTDERRQQDISHLTKSQVDAVPKIQQPHSSNVFSNNSPPTINSDVLNNIFEQHVTSDKKERQSDMNAISSINNDHFISSQFVDKSVIINADDDNSSPIASENQSKKLLDSSQILNEWLNSHSPERNDLVDDDYNNCTLSYFSLSESKKKIQRNSTQNCFL